MLFSAAVDTAIGTMLVYLVLSLFCMSINEAIAGLLRLRSRILYSEIGRILGDSELLKAFWDTGLMKSLSRRSAVTPLRPGRSPSYLDRDDFVRALIEALRKVGSADDGTASPKPGIASLPEAEKNSIIYGVLQELGMGSEVSLGRARDTLGKWFDDVMERASGVYKRYMSLLSFLVALLLVVAVNADTLLIARTIWADDALRTQLAASATEITKAADTATGTLPVADQILESVRSSLPIPLGWDTAECSQSACLALNGAKIIGLLLTVFAVTLGAPFWFDLLSLFVALRNSGPPPNRKKS